MQQLTTKQQQVQICKLFIILPLLSTLSPIGTLQHCGDFSIVVKIGTAAPMTLLDTGKKKLFATQIHNKIKI